MATNRVTGLAAEVLNGGATPNARVTGLAVAVLNSGGTSAARVTSQYVEVLTSTDDVASSEIDLAADLLDDSTMSVNLVMPQNLAASLADDATLTAAIRIPVNIKAALTDDAALTAAFTNRFELAADIVDGSAMGVSLSLIQPITLAASLADDARMVGALANVTGDGPFHFAWVDPDETQFVAGSMARDDEDIFAFSLSQNEGDFASLSLTIKNPRIGLLNVARKKWAWLSYFKNGVATPLFFGRLVGIPNNLFDTQITIELVGRPADYVARKAALAETLRVAPHFDPLFVAPDLWEDDDVVLEARSANWHIDRVTHAVTISDTITPEDGVIELQETDHFRDGLQIQLQNVPLRRVVLTCAIPWTQSAGGVVSLSSTIAAAWPRDADGYRYPYLISSFTFAGLQKDWPAPGRKMGKSWTVLNGGLEDVSFTTAGGPIIPPNIDRTLLPGPVSFGSIILDPALAIKYHTTGADVYTQWSYKEAAAQGNLPVTIVPRGWGVPTLDLQYNVERSFTENVLISLETDVQSIVTEAGEDEYLALNVTCNPVSSLSRDGTIPIGNVARRTFCDTARGIQALEYLTLLARANLIDRSRVVNTTVDMADFEQAMDVTLRKGLLVHDGRLPGGQASGKVTGYVLSFADGVAKASVSITSAIGYGDAVSETDGAPVYVEDDYVENDYQVHVGGVSLLPSGDVGISVPEIVPNDDGFDFIGGVRSGDIVKALSVANGPAIQKYAFDNSALYPYGQFGDPAEVSSILQGVPTQVHMSLKSIGAGPFATDVTVTSTMLMLPQQINLEAGSV